MGYACLIFGVYGVMIPMSPGHGEYRVQEMAGMSENFTTGAELAPYLFKPLVGWPFQQDLGVY